jgi:hypothetical protein
MLTPQQESQLMSGPILVTVFNGFDPDSKTMSGPFQIVGDCIADEHRLGGAYIEDRMSIRTGDLGIWFMPSQPEGEQYACKWLVQDSAGDGWLACKYFAVRYRPDFHKAAGRVVGIVLGAPGTFDEPLSQRLAQGMRDLRASPPRRDDVLVFAEDLIDPAAIVAEINKRIASR